MTSRFAGILLLFLQAPAFAAHIENGGTPRKGWIWETTPEHLAIAAALRASRKADASATPDLLKQIAGAGENSVQAGFDILVHRRVPEVQPEDPPQILSEPQEALLLAALAREPEAELRSEIDARLAREPDDAGARLAAITALGAIGHASDLPRMAQLAPPGPALRSGCAAILGRDARAFPVMTDLLARADGETGKVLLDALGSVRDPRATEVFYHAARAQAELRPQAVALVVGSGRSPQASINKEFATWMAAELRLARPAYARALLQGLGVLDDGSHAGEMIDHLESDDASVRNAALWGLQRVSGLGFAADPRPWLAWHKEELNWHANRRSRLKDDLVSNDAIRLVAALRSYAEHRTRRAELAVEVAPVLAHPRAELRRLACEVLETLGEPCVAGALAGALEDSDPTVSEAAWKALKKITGLELPKDPKRALEVLGTS